MAYLCYVLSVDATHIQDKEYYLWTKIRPNPITMT